MTTPLVGIATSHLTGAEAGKGSIELFAAAPQTLIRLLCGLAAALESHTDLSQQMAKLSSLLPMVAIAVITAGCGDVVCTLPPRPAIKADIRDSVTGAAAAFRASLVVTNETVYDSSFFGGVPGIPFDTASFSTVTSAANGRSGTYTVRVRRPGYRLWELTNVRVGGDRCGADATELLVRLQPTP